MFSPAENFGFGSFKTFFLESFQVNYELLSLGSLETFID